MSRRSARPWLLGLAVAAATACGPPPLDELVVSVPWESDSLDPHARNTLSNFALASSVYEALVTTDVDMRLQPALAVSWENPDRSTWLFHLRPGVRFHSGRPLRADDVVWSLRRPTREPGLEMAGYVLYIESVEAVDEATVRVRTTQPLSILLNKLRFVAILPEGSDRASVRERPDGTGPYRVAAWLPERELRLVRNEGWWGSAPTMSRVRFRLGRDADRAAQDLLDGTSQLVQSNSRRAARRIRDDPRVRVERRTSLFLKYLAYDMRPAAEGEPPNPFARLAVRQAIHHGLDRQRVADALSTEAEPAGQLVPPTIFGFNPRLRVPTPDPPRARALLAEAGFPDGFATELFVRRLYTEAALQVRDELAPLGIDVAVRELPDPEFLDRARRRELGFYLSRFGCPTGDASDILDNALHTHEPARRRGGQNYGHYSNPDVDKAIDLSAAIESVADRRAALEQVMEMILHDLAWIPLFVDQDVYGVDDRLSWQPRNDSFILPAEVGLR